MKGVFLEKLEIWTTSEIPKGTNWPDYTLKIGEYNAQGLIEPAMDIQEMFYDFEKDRVLITDGREVAGLNLSTVFLYKYKEKSQEVNKLDVRNSMDGQKMTQ